MKIGFDAKRITHNSTGLGNYSRFIVEALAKYFPDNTYYLFTPSKGKETLYAKLMENHAIQLCLPHGMWALSLLKNIWRACFSLQNNQNINVYHGLSNELPFGLKQKNVKSVVTIHDLIFMRYPEYYTFIDKCIYTSKVKHACQQADKIIAVSEMTKQDIIRYFNVSEDKIVVVYQGCNKIFLAEPALPPFNEEVRKLYTLPEHYNLYVGSIESRKNLKIIIEAMAKMTNPTHLVAVGKRTPYTAEVEMLIKKYSLTDKVTMLHGVGFAELPAIYAMASIFIYPSFFEGFGIPIVEALNMGIPVIAATGSCLEEAGGTDSLYIDPHNSDDLVEKINIVENSKELQERMIANGKEHAKKFSDSYVVNALMEVYKTL